MSHSDPLLNPAVPPEEFVEQVKQALEHLYDFTFLQRLPLATAVAPAQPQANQTLGHHLRRELITAIEAISPGPHSSALLSDARLYNLLQLRYIEGITVQDAANRLGLSARQAHRSLRRGEESVAAILWARRRSVPPLEPEDVEDGVSARELSSVAAEISLLETHLQLLDVRDLLRDALRAVAPLAQQRNLTFAVTMPDEPVAVSLDTAVSRQIFASLLSRVLRAAAEAPALRLNLRQGQVTLTVGFIPAASGNPLIVDEVIEQLAARLGWTIRQKKVGGNGRQTIIIKLTGHEAVILVVDDNEGLVELLDRYLTGHDCRVITSTSGQEGLKLAQELIPDAIILDVMMPGASGWEILQTLRSQPATQAIPVIVCSVFNDPELAYALGATRFHSKPITRDVILTTLRELGVV